MQLSDESAQLGEIYKFAIHNPGPEAVGRLIWGRHSLLGQREIPIKQGLNWYELPVSIDMVPSFKLMVLIQHPFENQAEPNADKGYQSAVNL
ncbi:hypothetical protein DF186_15350, partial [Enterococcus hirae]